MSRGGDPKRGVANFEPRLGPSMGRKKIGIPWEHEGIHRSGGADPKRGVANFELRLDPSMGKKKH